MPKIAFDHVSSHSPEKAYGAIKTFLNNPEEIKKFDANLKCDFNEATKSCNLKGSQFKGEFKVFNEGTGSKVSIVLDIPLLLMPLKGKIQEMLTKKLNKHLS